jgi:hypothetical protein
MLATDRIAVSTQLESPAAKTSHHIAARLFDIVRALPDTAKIKLDTRTARWW